MRKLALGIAAVMVAVVSGFWVLTAGAVTSKPLVAVQVDEFSVFPGTQGAPKGRVGFVVTNIGTIRSNLLRPPGLRWAASLRLPAHARLQVDSLLAVMAALEAQLDGVDAELRRFARGDERCQALQTIYGVGPIIACHLLAEIGEARRFRRPDQITRLAGLDPVVDESGDNRRRGKLAKAGSPHLRWALVEAAVHAHRPTQPDLTLYRTTRERRHTAVARLTIARTIGKRAFHALRELELATT